MAAPVNHPPEVVEIFDGVFDGDRLYPMMSQLRSSCNCALFPCKEHCLYGWILLLSLAG